MPLPLSKAVRNSVESALCQATPLLFQDSVNEVLAYIEIYQFPRFAKSSSMNKVITMLALEAAQPRANKRRASITLQPSSVTTSIKYDLPIFFFVMAFTAHYHLLIK